MDNYEQYTISKFKNIVKTLYYTAKPNGVYRDIIDWKQPLEFNQLLQIYKEITQLSSNTIMDNFNEFFKSNDNIIKNLHKNISYKLTKQKDVMHILNKLLKISPNSFVVGGCVRDICLKQKPKDYDFVTDIPYDNLKIIFRNEQYTLKETGKHFLVLNVTYKGKDYEIANFRSESNYSNHRNPDCVRIGTVVEDMKRRDFTINSLYWNPNQLLYLNEGIDDILSKRLRFIGNPIDRLQEDYLRGWRFYRLLKTKNLTPDKKSLKAVRSNFHNILLVSPNRIMNEIERIIGL